jgi:hypothetical protein
MSFATSRRRAGVNLGPGLFVERARRRPMFAATSM